MPAPEFKQRVATDGNSHEHCSSNLELAAQSIEVGSKLLHADRTFTSIGIAVRPQIGQDHAVPAGELVEHAVPEVMMQGKGMQQHYLGACAGDFVNQLCVAAADRCHDAMPTLSIWPRKLET